MLDGTLNDATGSDGIYFLDGRNKISTMIADANKRITQLSAVKNYKYFEIRRGSISKSNVIYRNFNPNDFKMGEYN